MRMVRTWILILWLMPVCSLPAWAGSQTTNDFFYKPSQGARGSTEKANFDSGLDRVDARLGKEVWVGDPKYGSTLQDAIAAIGSSSVTLRVPAGTYSIPADLSIPGNIALRMEKAAIFAIADAKTLSIYGPLEAGLYQVFSCTGNGKVVFGKGRVKEIYPQWWGAVADGATDDRGAIQAAVTTACTSAGGMTVAFPTGTYYLNSFGLSATNVINYSSDLPYNIRMQGVGNPIVSISGTFKNSTADAGFNLFSFIGAGDITVDGITFQRPSAAIDKNCNAFDLESGNGTYPKAKFTNNTFWNIKTGIWAGASPGLIVQNCRFYSYSGYASFFNGGNTNPAVGIGGGDNAYNRDWLIDGNEFDGCTSGAIAAGGTYACAMDGLIYNSGPGTTVTNNRIRHHGFEGIFIYNQVTAPVSTMKHVISGNVIDSTPATGQTHVLAPWGIRCDQGSAVITNNVISNAFSGIFLAKNDAGSPDQKDIDISNNVIKMAHFEGGAAWDINGIRACGFNVRVHDNVIVWPDDVAGYSAHIACGIFAGADNSAIYNNRIVIETPNSSVDIAAFGLWSGASRNIRFWGKETKGMNAVFQWDSGNHTGGGPVIVENHHSINDTLFAIYPPHPSYYPKQFLVKNQTYTWTPAAIGWYRVLAKPWNLSAKFVIGLPDYSDTALEVCYRTDNSSDFTGSLNQLRFQHIGAGDVVRVGTVNGKAYICALDINVAVANKPITLSFHGNEQYELFLLSEEVGGIYQTRSVPEQNPTVPDHLKNLTFANGIACSGGVTVGNETVNYLPGTIIYDGTHFKGWNGSAWKQLDN